MRRLDVGSSVEVLGVLAESPGAKQSSELRATSLRVLGSAASHVRLARHDALPDLADACRQIDALKDLPHLSTARLRQMPHMRCRLPVTAATLRIRDAMAVHARTFFRVRRQSRFLARRTYRGSFAQDLGFCHAETPIITFSDCEGGGDVFEFAPPPDPRSQAKTAARSEALGSASGAFGPPQMEHSFFGGSAFATVSAQLHLEALCSGLTRVWTLAPAFRAERSQTARHLAEFWMLEAEVAFVDRLDQIMDLVEGLVKAVARGICTSHASADDLDVVRKHLAFDDSIIGRRWPRLSYSAAIEILQGAEKAPPALRTIQWGEGLSSVQEKWLTNQFGCPVFVTDYPAALKPFYMRPGTAARTAACFDLLAPGIGELAGGSLREERLSMLQEAIKVKGLDPGQYDWYLDLRRQGTVPHGGFGLGWDRLVAWITGHDNVRECLPFPRTFDGVRCA